MRYPNLLFYTSLLVPTVILAQPSMEYRQLSLPEAEKLLLLNNQTLKMKDTEVLEAEGELKQSKAGENPEIAILHNVKNPTSGRYFDFGRDGETDIQVSQRVFIGGQRKNAVRRNTALVHASVADKGWTQRELLSLLSKTLIGIDGCLKKDSLYEMQTSMLQRILNAHTASAAKGNVSQLELSKIKAMLYIAERSRLENRTKLAEEEAVVKVLLGIDYAIVPTLPSINQEEVEHVVKMIPQLELRSDIQHSNHLIDAARRDISLQKSNALPEINLTAEWDKNGNIGPNFFGIGASITLPLANRNKGNKAIAKAKHAQAVIGQQQKLKEAAVEIQMLQEQIVSLTPLALCHTLEEQKNQIGLAEVQYMKRNLSMQEFSAIFETFNETINAFIDNNVDLRIAVEELKKAKGL